MGNSLTRKQRFILAFTALVGIIGIVGLALMQGIDGQVLSGGLGALAAAGGWFARGAIQNKGDK